MLFTRDDVEKVRLGRVSDNGNLKRWSNQTFDALYQTCLAIAPRFVKMATKSHGNPMPSHFEIGYECVVLLTNDGIMVQTRSTDILRTGKDEGTLYSRDNYPTLRARIIGELAKLPGPVASETGTGG